MCIEPSGWHDAEEVNLARLTWPGVPSKLQPWYCWNLKTVRKTLPKYVQSTSSNFQRGPFRWRRFLDTLLPRSEKHPKVSKNRDNLSILNAEIENLAAVTARELWPSLDEKVSRTNAKIEALKKVVELKLETDEKKTESLQGLFPQISYISGFEEAEKILETP